MVIKYSDFRRKVFLVEDETVSPWTLKDLLEVRVEDLRPPSGETATERMERLERHYYDSGYQPPFYATRAAAEAALLKNLEHGALRGRILYRPDGEMGGTVSVQYRPGVPGVVYSGEAAPCAAIPGIFETVKVSWSAKPVTLPDSRAARAIYVQGPDQAEPVLLRFELTGRW